MRDLIKGKKWLLLSRWKNLAPRQRGVLNRLFEMNRRVFKAYMLKESLERLWDYRYEGAMLKYLRQWMATFACSSTAGAATRTCATCS